MRIRHLVHGHGFPICQDVPFPDVLTLTGPIGEHGGMPIARTAGIEFDLTHLDIQERGRIRMVRRGVEKDVGQNLSQSGHAERRSK